MEEDDDGHEGYDEEQRAAARDMMINISVDSTLASSIMSTIVGSSISSQPSSLLSCLQVENARSMGIPHMLGEILDKLDFRWRCLRFRDGDQVRIITRKTKRKNRESEFMKGRRELGDYQPVFRGLWPGESGFWENDWHSFPLASPESSFTG
jgi:hypothetical protein